jgi:uncharacterized protein (TIGR02466 family)
VLKQVLARELFSSPLRGFDVPDAEPLNEALLAAIAVRRKSEDGVKVSNEFGWHSKNDLFVRPEPAFRKIAGHITNALLFTIRQTTPGFDLAVHDVEGEGWTNVSERGAFNTPHAHGEFLWSGVYYVNTPETSSAKSGMLEFIDPRRGASVGGNLRPAIFSPKFQIRPRSGLMLIFPSYLLHWVYPNQEVSPRVSIAFNAKIVSRGISRLTEPA